MATARGARRKTTAVSRRKAPPAASRRTAANRPPTLNELAADAARAWAVNERVNIALLRAIPPKGFAIIPSGTRGRTIARVFVHLHKVRVGWLEFQEGKRAKSLSKFPKGKEPSRAELLRGLKASGAAVGAFIEDAVAGEARVKWFKGSALRWMGYMIAHDAHHRGQIALALKQHGMKLPEAVALKGLWYEWYFGKP